MLIPPNMVTAVVGKHGTPIEGIQKFSSTHIQIAEEMKTLNERQVLIDGKPGNIVKAAAQLYRLIVDEPPEPVAASSGETEGLRFVVPEDCVGYLIGKCGAFTKRLKNEYRVELRVERFEQPPCQEGDHVAVTPS